MAQNVGGVVVVPTKTVADPMVRMRSAAGKREEELAVRANVGPIVSTDGSSRATLDLDRSE
jgi:hypothetical protein